MLTTKLGGHSGFGGQYLPGFEVYHDSGFLSFIEIIFSATYFSGKQQKMAEKFSGKELEGTLHLH